MTGRLAVTLVTAVGALAAGIAAQSAGSPLASLGWAVLAGVGLSLMLRGFGLRVVGILVAVVGVGGAGWSVDAGQWVALAGFVIVVLGAGGFIVWGPGWRLRPRPDRVAHTDLWKAMDEGEDPTGEQVVSDDSNSG